MYSVYSRNWSFHYLLFLSAMVMFALSLNAQGGGGVQFRTQGDFTGNYAYLNDIPTNGLDIDSDGNVDIIPACSCRSAEVIANGENSDAGYFDDQLIIATGVSGQSWTLAAHQNILSPLDLAPLSNGTLFNEIGNTGIYILKFVHSESSSYNAFVDGGNGVLGPVENQCFYPDPEIMNLDTFYCDDAENISLFGITTSPFDGNVDWLAASNENWFIEREEDGFFQFSSIFSPGELGEGTYQVSYIYDAGYAMDHTNRTGCMRTAKMQVKVQAAYPMICNGTLGTSIGVNSCEVVLTPDNLLAGAPLHPENFIIDVITQEGVNIGPILTADYVGQTLTAIITDNCNGAFCTANIILQDFHPPVLSIPNDTIISCLSAVTPSVTGFAEATDCQSVVITYEDEWIDLDCNDDVYSARIIRTWSAVDPSGNESQGAQQIFIKLGGVSDLLFPDDVSYECSDWLANPSITDATLQGAGRPNLTPNSPCRIAASFMDDTLPLCGNTDRNFIILRKWTVINLCTNEILTIDSQEKDPIQFITVKDEKVPDMSTQPVVLPVDVGQLEQENGVCASRGFIPAPIYFDDCNEVTIHIYSSIGELDYVNGTDGRQGGFLPAPGLPLGDHLLSYEIIDDCGNSQLLEDELTIVDEEAPQVICNPALTVVLPSNGHGVLYASSIDENSRDNCCVDQVLVKKSGEPDTEFATFVEFFCENEVLEIILRVTDCAGNYNECSSFVTVRDNQSPYIIQVSEDEFLVCGDDISAYLDGDYHAPVFGDNCGYDVNFSTSLDLNDCGIGRLLRRWEAQDNDVNETAVDSQFIWLQPNHDYEITLPSDAVMSCPLVSFNDVELKSFGCDLLTANVTFDTLITNSNGLCMTIFRSYSIVNWCEYDGESEATVLPRLVDDGTGLATGYVLHSNGEILLRSVPGTELPVGISTGFYSYQQQIHIVDSQAPTLEVQSQLNYCLNGECRGNVNLLFVVTDDCTALPFVEYKVLDETEGFVQDTIGELISMGENSYRIAGLYPSGNYTFQIEMRDNCGAIDRVPVLLTVGDCTAPEISCINDVFIDLDEQGEYELYTSDVLLEVMDACSEVNTSFMEMEAQVSLLYGCGDTGVDTLEVWAIDEAGNRSSCEVFVHVRDTVSNCISFYHIAGQVGLAEGDGVGDVDVFLVGSINSEGQTDDSGAFLFEDVPEADSYRLTASKQDQYINGVSTFDIIRVQRHLLGTLPLSSPYKILAADVNDSGIVSTLDIIYMRKLILGISTTFPNRPEPWFFIPADYEFEHPLEPLLENFPRSITVSPLDTNKVVNFIGIKVGDVNNSVVL